MDIGFIIASILLKVLKQNGKHITGHAPCPRRERPNPLDLITRYILKFTKIETYGKNLIKIDRFQMPQYIGCPMEKACLAYVKISGIFPA